MKSVFENSMVAHVWAAQSQATGRSSNGNFFFDGRELFSYGRHFVVGLILPVNVAVLNSDSYSKSTAKQQSYARRAVSHMHVYSVPKLTAISYALPECDGAKTDKHIAAAVRKHVAENIESISEKSAVFLLSISGAKTPDATQAKMRADKKRADEKAKAKDAAEKKTDRLVYAARVSKLVKSEKDLVSGLANIFGNGHKLTDAATRLHHAQRAAKAAKRDKQAAECWRVLLLVRAEIKHRENIAARKSANAWAKDNIRGVRGMFQALQTPGQTVSAYHARQFVSQCENVLAFPRCKVAAERLSKLRDGFAACAVALDEKEKREAAEKEARAMADWLAGVPGARAPYRYDGKTMLRALHVTRDESGAINGGTLQTSRGADCPLTHAIRAFRFLKLVRERGEGWHANGHTLRVGHFRVDRIAANGDMHAGCHFISWEETARLAVALGIFESAASDSALEETAHAA